MQHISLVSEDLLYKNTFVAPVETFEESSYQKDVLSDNQKNSLHNWMTV